MRRDSVFVTRFVVGVAVACCLALSAARADINPDLIAAAKKEGQLNWYYSNQSAEILATGFTKKYGIPVSKVRNASTVQTLKLISEYRANHVVADALDITVGVPGLIDAGVIKPFKLDNAANIDPQYKDPKGYWVATMLFVQMVVTNSDLVSEKEQPKNLDDLLNPKWKGKMVWNPGGSTGANGFIANILTSRGEEKGMEYLRKLKTQNVLSLDISSRAIADQIIAGEYTMGLGLLQTQAESSSADGAPIVALRLEPYLATTAMVTLTAKAPHPNAGLLFAEYELSQEGQALYAKNYFAVRDDVPPPPGLVADDRKKLNVISPDTMNASFDHWTDVYNQLFR
jgi:iron(III) transport system substrate-binding protein